jgi:hypothetical protein
MPITIDEAVAVARKDLAARRGAAQSDIDHWVEEADFPDAALGAGEDDEMSGQMITPGWRILLNVDRKKYEYRANKHQVRLFNFKGRNYKIK